MLTYTKVHVQGGSEVYYLVLNGTSTIGALCEEVDGFFYFFPHTSGGFWDGAMMKDISHKLEALNEAWSQRLNEELAKLPKGEPKL